MKHSRYDTKLLCECHFNQIFWSLYLSKRSYHLFCTSTFSRGSCNELICPTLVFSAPWCLSRRFGTSKHFDSVISIGDIAHTHKYATRVCIRSVSDVAGGTVCCEVCRRSTCLFQKNLHIPNYILQNIYTRYQHCHHGQGHFISSFSDV